MVALIGLLLSAWIGAVILKYFIPEMSTLASWIYSTPLAILSSAIIIPSVNTLRGDKKEFHIYESTFSDILGIMLFFFLIENVLFSENGLSIDSIIAFDVNIILTIVISFVASYFMLIIFQKIKSHVKLFLLISVLLLLYAIAKKMHLSSLLIILVFGVMIANMEVFFRGPLKKFVNKSISKSIFDGLHVITQESAFVVRTLFFVVFGLTIVLGSLADSTVVMISLFILLSIYIVRYILLRTIIGKDFVPQLYIAPRGLITIILFYEIPEIAQVAEFSEGILLFIIISTSIIMTLAMIFDKKRSQGAINSAKKKNVGYKVLEISDPISHSGH
jgi:NhaP-type Na+/H+ or K+/H+ antiporter